jgi:hypothetical protein
VVNTAIYNFWTRSWLTAWTLTISFLLTGCNWMHFKSYQTWNLRVVSFTFVMDFLPWRIWTNILQLLNISLYFIRSHREYTTRERKQARWLKLRHFWLAFWSQFQITPLHRLPIELSKVSRGFLLTLQTGYHFKSDLNSYLPHSFQFIINYYSIAWQYRVPIIDSVALWNINKTNKCR